MCTFSDTKQQTDDLNNAKSNNYHVMQTTFCLSIKHTTITRTHKSHVTQAWSIMLMLCNCRVISKTREVPFSGGGCYLNSSTLNNAEKNVHSEMADTYCYISYKRGQKLIK